MVVIASEPMNGVDALEEELDVVVLVVLDVVLVVLDEVPVVVVGDPPLPELDPPQAARVAARLTEAIVRKDAESIAARWASDRTVPTNGA